MRFLVVCVIKPQRLNSIFSESDTTSDWIKLISLTGYGIFPITSLKIIDMNFMYLFNSHVHAAAHLGATGGMALYGLGVKVRLPYCRRKRIDLQQTWRRCQCQQNI